MDIQTQGSTLKLTRCMVGLLARRERVYLPASIKAMIEIVKQMPRHVVLIHPH